MPQVVLLLDKVHMNRLPKLKEGKGAAAGEPPPFRILEDNEAIFTSVNCSIATSQIGEVRGPHNMDYNPT